MQLLSVSKYFYLEKLFAAAHKIRRVRHYNTANKKKHLTETLLKSTKSGRLAENNARKLHKNSGKICIAYPTYLALPLDIWIKYLHKGQMQRYSLKRDRKLKCRIV